MKQYAFTWLVIFSVVGPRALAEDWPMFRADAARSGYSADPLPERLVLRWRHACTAGPSPAWPSSGRITFDFAYQPIVVDGAVLYGTSSNDQVVALDALSGKPRWSFFAGGPIRFAPAAWRDRVFAASDDGHLYALSLADGRLLWKHRGGPNGRMCLGNGRMISRWPARGGPVVVDDVVYFAAGIWPSDGVYLHALNAESGKVLWTNDSAGGLYMPQPHGGANAESGVTPQGYLLADAERLFVPTGRAVPAAFGRSDGRFEHYLLQQNGSMGGCRAIAAERFLINGGCFLEKETGKLAARAGRGVFSASPQGVLRFTGHTLLAYRWADLEEPDRKGNTVEYRGLERLAEVALADESLQERQAEDVMEKLPALADLYRTRIRFKDVFDNVPKQTGLERTLSQSRPDVVALGGDVTPFLATTYEREHELIQAGDEAVCGGPGVVRVVDLTEGRVRWSHQVEGSALGLAAADGQLIVSTTDGSIYCFGTPVERPAVATTAAAPLETTAPEIDYAKAADEILRRSGLSHGICIDLGCDMGLLALELARRSNLRVIGLDSDAAKVEAARRRIDAAGLYGARVSIHHGDPAQPPFSRYSANLIVSSQGLRGESAGLDQAEVERLQRPYGGVVCLGKPGALELRRRGPLEGAGQWTHQNCDPANTLCSTDRVVRGPLEVAWFGDGVLEIPDRHAQGPAPLFLDGCLVVVGVDGLCALDAYNGRTLWTYRIEGILADWDGVHHDVGVGDTGGNFCLGHGAVFVRTDDRCLKIDLHTGKKLFEVKTPVEPSARNRAWAYIACSDGLLFGSVANDEHTISPRYENIRLRNESVLLFAMNAETGELEWQFEPKHSLRNNAIAVAGGRVYLIDRPQAPADRITAPTPNGKHRPLLKPGEHPGGTLIALDAATGDVLWENADDVFGTQIAVSQPHGVLIMHYQAVKHGFFKLPSEIGGRLAAFDLATGSRRWDRKAKFVTRPLLNDDVIYAEGGAWNLISGEPVPWKFERSYGCGQIAASTHLMLFRSATLGYLDLARDVGTESFGGIRPSCWFSAVPAGGLVLVPDGSSKCACSYQTRAWLALQRRR